MLRPDRIARIILYVVLHAVQVGVHQVAATGEIPNLPQAGIFSATNQTIACWFAWVLSRDDVWF
jgi:hypothetical protein